MESEDDDERLRKLVEGSGFPFQLAVERLIRTTADQHQWEIETREHPWRDDRGREGFLDLVLRHRDLESLMLVIETKLQRRRRWVFLLPKPRDRPRGRIRSRWTIQDDKRGVLWGWDDYEVEPASYQAEFCAVEKKDGDDGQAMLERFARDLVAGVDAFAAEAAALASPPFGYCWVLVPVIVTAAPLFVARFDPSTVSLTDDVASTPQFERVPLVRFRRTLVTDVTPWAKPRDPEQARASRERTVLIVDASQLANVLSGWEIEIPRPPPWDAARRLANEAAGQ